MRLANAGLNRKESLLKIAAVAIGAVLVISSAAMFDVLTTTIPLDTSANGDVKTLFQNRPCEVKSVLTEDGSTWVSFDSSPPGTPAEAHVTVSDTSGLTIVADFHGFWRTDHTSNGTGYDYLDMPGASSTQAPGSPVLPCLFEYVEIPHNVDVSIEVLAFSADTRSGYNISPAATEDIPFVAERTLNVTQSTVPPLNFSQVYSNDAFFPGIVTRPEGGNSTSPLIMRGHRLMGLSFYPVHYNPVNTTLLVYSQIVIKLKYSTPAQIQPIAEHLRSEAFERILLNTLLNYDSCHILFAPEIGIAASREEAPPGFVEGAEYLIITNDTLKPQADRLAEWKERKGIPSAVVTITKQDEDEKRAEVKQIVADAYAEWHPAPTYVLLLGDVECIPANYDSLHWSPAFIPFTGYIASDLGYFNIDGHGYLPDMIYGRISVDTEEQARAVVNKILQYEIDPPMDESFYDSPFLAGDFYDENYDGVEDDLYPFVTALERIRHYLKDEYSVHINYSCAFLHYDRGSDGFVSPAEPYPGIYLEDLEFVIEIEGSRLVADSIYPDYPNFGWLIGYDNPDCYDLMRANITLNINDGRFFVLYYGHGGSKNMVHALTLQRDWIEGWQFPFFNTSYFSDLSNGIETPLIVSIACSTGWFDGEDDQDHMFVGIPLGHNRFEDCENECFAENITRLEGGGAVAAISPSRPAWSLISAHLMDGIIQAFWPGFLESTNQPLYEMGAALIFAKLYAKEKWDDLGVDLLRKVETTFEEYHLFGDPETQLWTDTPTWINVSYPDSVGTSSPQRFAVTVVESLTGDPITFAKVCIQQDSANDEYDVYEVGYTDSNGQVIFEVDPTANPSHLNVTVTKHNVRPHIGYIDVIHSEASISVSPNPVIGGDTLTIAFNEFLTETAKTIIIDGYHIVDLAAGIADYPWQVWPGPTRFMNVRAWSSTGVAVDYFQRVSSDDGPDPYLYSQDDPSTWDDPAGEATWDNPDIDISLDGVAVEWMTQNEEHEIVVTVHNNGIIGADSTTVILSYAAFGGGVSWSEVGRTTVSPTHDAPETATFKFTPTLAHGACLRVDLSHPDERGENKINNIGYENVNVVEMASPGLGTFHVGNPTDSTGYALIKVRQLGTHEDVWNTSILEYSYQAMNAGESETVKLFIDSLHDLNDDDGRLFRVEIYFDCALVGGMIFNATKVKEPGIGIIELIIIGGTAIIAIIAVIVAVRRRR